MSGAGHVEQRRQIHADDVIPLFRRHLVEHAVPRDARIIDQDIDRCAGGLFGSSNAPNAVVVITDVELDGGDTGFLGEGLRLLLIARIVRDDCMTGLFERQTNRRADAARTTRYQCCACHLRSP